MHHSNVYIIRNWHRERWERLRRREATGGAEGSR